MTKTEHILSENKIKKDIKKISKISFIEALKLFGNLISLLTCKDFVKEATEQVQGFRVTLPESCYNAKVLL